MLFLSNCNQNAKPQNHQQYSTIVPCEGKPHFSTPRCQVSLGINGIFNMFTVNASFHIAQGVFISSSIDELSSDGLRTGWGND